MYQPKNKNFDLKTYDDEIKKMHDYEVIEKTKVIAEGFWRGRHFVIGKNRFCIPVVYVEWRGKLPPGDEYFGKAYWLSEDQRGDTMYYGWDHGHYGDYIPYDFAVHAKLQKDCHIWSIEEILMEIADFIAVYENYETTQVEDDIESNLE